MNLEETTPGTQFKYLGGVFALGQSYPIADSLYVKGPNEAIYETSLSDFKRKVRDGVYELIEAPALGAEETTQAVITDLYKVASRLLHDQISEYAPEWEFSKRTPKKDIQKVLNTAALFNEGHRLAAIKLKSIAARLLKTPALGGRSIQSEGPSASECEGDRPQATPSLSVESITSEALEKEPGWKKAFYDHGNGIYVNGVIEVDFMEGEMIGVTMDYGSRHPAAGCKSMPDLRTLVRLVNEE